MENTKNSAARTVAGCLVLFFYYLMDQLSFPSGICIAYAVLSYLILGLDVLKEAVENIFEGNLFGEEFLMSLATIGAMAIGNFGEAVLVMLLFNIGEALEEKASEKSMQSIEKLLALEPDFARIVNNDKSTLIVSPKEVRIGSVIRVLPGERIPLDGTIIYGKALVDTKTITGESTPLSVNVGTFVLSGYVVTDSPVNIAVSTEYSDSTLGRIMAFTENAGQNKSKTEKFITRFARWYTPAVCILALLLAVIPSILTGEWSVWIEKSLILLIISCPCALVISVPLAFVSGMGKCSAMGILVKSASELENLSMVKTFAFDKTGTITEGIFEVTSYSSEETLLLAYSLEKESNHPIAKAVCRKCNSMKLPYRQALDVFEESGFGLKGVYNGKELFCGNGKLLEKHGIHFEPNSELYGSIIYVAYDGNYIGSIVVSDIVKPNAKEALKSLKKNGITQNVILSGDRNNAVEHIAKEVGADSCFGELLPLEKVKKLSSLKAKSKVAYVGDGINDAPVLAVSDVGISMGKLGSDIAIEASGIVITTDNLDRLSDALKAAKKTISIAKQNIAFALGIKVLCIVLGFFALIPMSLAVFSDTGVTVLCVLNCARALRNN